MKKILLLIFILAFSLRLFTVISQGESERIPGSDAKDYDNLAVNILSGDGFYEVVNGQKAPVTRRTPLYPLFLAGIYAIFGHSYIAVKIIQAVLGALLCIIIFFIANIIYNDRSIAIISAFLVVIYKPFVSGFHYYGGPALILSEYLYMFLVGLSILALLLYIKKENKEFGILAGILMGLSILTRPDFATYPFLLIFCLFCAYRLSIKRVVKRYFIVYFFIALTLAPWVLRNYIVEGEFIPLTSHGGLTFFLGNNSSANGGWADPEDYAGKVYGMKNVSDYERNIIWFKKAIGELKSDPGRIPRLIIKKILVHWVPFEKGIKVFNPYYAVILLFGSIGILFLRKNSIMEMALLTILLSTTLTAMIIWGEPRHRYPYEPYLIIFAALAINKIFIITQRKVLGY